MGTYRGMRRWLNYSTAAVSTHLVMGFGGGSDFVRCQEFSRGEKVFAERVVKPHSLAESWREGASPIRQGPSMLGELRLNERKKRKEKKKNTKSK